MKRIRKWAVLAVYSVVLVAAPLVYNAGLTAPVAQPTMHLVCSTGGTGGGC